MARRVRVEDRPFFGASVRGPAHRSQGQPNQDAWLGGRRSFGTLIVVCDGLGSRANSAVGAREACRAVREALGIWSRRPGAPERLLFGLIAFLWNIRVHPATGKDSATTCLFAAALRGGPLVAAGLGDGLVAVQVPGQAPHILGGSRTSFANETTGLGLSGSASDWKLHTLPQPPPGTRVLLASDGVSDDIVPERLPGLLDHLDRTYRPLAPAQRARRLTGELRNWATPKHTDDKTLAFLWSRAEEVPGHA
jgi:hypothetical protein